MKLDQQLVDAAIAEIERRFPNEIGIAAALYTSQGEILTGVRFRIEYGPGRLCAETEPMLNAHRHGKRITASVCLYRDPLDGRYLVLSPCGLCQERLLYWGKDVEVAVPDPHDPACWISRTLHDLVPHYWRDVL